MATTREEISRWLERGRVQGATHVIIACDTFSHEGYPVYVKPEEDVRSREKEIEGKDMTRVMEVYSMKRDLQSQLNEAYAFHYD